MEAMIKEEGAKFSCDKCKAIYDKAKSLQRPNTEAVIKEESAKCSCDKCKAIFDKAKSLHILKDRSHRSQWEGDSA